MFIRSVPFIPYFLDILEFPICAGPKGVPILGTNDYLIVGAFDFSRSALISQCSDHTPTTGSNEVEQT